MLDSTTMTPRPTLVQWHSAMFKCTFGNKHQIWHTGRYGCLDHYRLYNHLSSASWRLAASIIERGHMRSYKCVYFLIYEEFFSFCFLICIQEMFTDWRISSYQHFIQVNTLPSMKKCDHDKKNYQKCHRNGYNFEFDDCLLNFWFVHPGASYSWV